MLRFSPALSLAVKSKKKPGRFRLWVGNRRKRKLFRGLRVRWFRSEAGLGESMSGRGHQASVTEQGQKSGVLLAFFVGKTGSVGHIMGKRCVRPTTKCYRITTLAVFEGWFGICHLGKRKSVCQAVIG